MTCAGSVVPETVGDAKQAVADGEQLSVRDHFVVSRTVSEGGGRQGAGDYPQQGNGPDDYVNENVNDYVGEHVYVDVNR